jgi:hypothetical protein
MGVKTLSKPEKPGTPGKMFESNDPKYPLKPADFEFGMCMFASINNPIYDGHGREEKDHLYVMAGDECRAVGMPLYAPFIDQVIFLVYVYSNLVYEEGLRLEYYSKKLNKLFYIPGVFTFVDNEILGTPQMPMAFRKADNYYEKENK